MAKSVYDDDPIDLKKPLPDGYKALVKEMRELINSGVRGSKKLFWNMGRYVQGFMDDSSKYGKNSIEHLETDLGISKAQLYNYATAYSAYTAEALERVCGRDKVIASAMIFIAKLPTDAERDQAERKIQNAEPAMTKQDVLNTINEMLGGRRKPAGKSSGGSKGSKAAKGERAPNPTDAATVVKKQAPKEFYEMHLLALEGVLDECSTTGAQIEAALKPQLESLPKDVRDARKAYIKKIGDAADRLLKLKKLMEDHGV